MNTLVLEFKKLTPICLIVVALGSFAFSPQTRAVCDSPDPGCPGGNLAEGHLALGSLSGGLYNTGIGAYSLLSDSTGSLNTATGAGTLLSNTAGQNTATGAGALLSNSTGEGNTANGAFALISNTTASGNTAIGSNALFSNTTGGTLGNIGGFDVGPNVAVGSQALQSNTIASANTAVGYQALGSNTTGFQGTGLGASTAVGFQALANATGPDAGANDAFGYQALFNLTGGINNVAIGTHALFGITTGENNVALGTSAGQNIMTGVDNICIGIEAGSGITTANNVIAIGAPGADVDNSCFIGNIRDVQTQVADAIPVMIDSVGQLGTASSSRRFKHDVKAMDKTSEAILVLKPVTFHYNTDKKNTPQFGLIAEEVAEVNPDLVVRDKNGEIYTVRYDAVNAMLLNEFLKEHRKNEKQEAMITELMAEIATLSATVNQQAAQIEKVSAQLELSKPAPQTAMNSH